MYRGEAQQQRYGVQTCSQCRFVDINRQRPTMRSRDHQSPILESPSYITFQTSDTRCLRASINKTTRNCSSPESHTKPNIQQTEKTKGSIFYMRSKASGANLFLLGTHPRLVYSSPRELYGNFMGTLWELYGRSLWDRYGNLQRPEITHSPLLSSPSPMCTERRATVTWFPTA